MNKIRLIESLYENIGFQMGVYTKDGKLVNGILTDIKDDFLTFVNDKKQTFFFSIDKIQAFSKNTKKFVLEDQKKKKIHEHSLMELIGNYIYSWVTVHCQNNLSFSGILSIVTDDHIILTVKEEKLYIQKDHIISFYPETLKESKPKERQEKSERDEKRDVNQQSKKEDKKLNKKEGKEEKKQNQLQEKKQDKKHGQNKEKKHENQQVQNREKKHENKQEQYKEKKEDYSRQKEKEHLKEDHSSKKTDSEQKDITGSYSENKSKRETISEAFKKVIKENLPNYESPLSILTNHLNALTHDSNSKNADDSKKDEVHSKTDSQHRNNQKSEVKNTTKSPRSGLQVKPYFGIPYKGKTKRNK